MNRRLVDPFQSLQLPETIEEYLDHGVATSLAFNRLGTLLATGTAEGNVVLWDWDTRGVARTFSGHKGAVTAVSWSRDGRYLASVCLGGVLLLWDVAEGTPAMEVSLPGAASGVSLRSVPPYQLVISMLEGSPLLLDAGTGQQQPLPMLTEADLQPGSKPGEAAGGSTSGMACFSKAGDMLFVGYGRGGVIAVLDARTLNFLDLYKLPGGARVLGIQLNRRGNYLLCNCHDKCIRLFEVLPREPVQQQAQQLAAATLLNSGGGAALDNPAALPSMDMLRSLLQEKPTKAIKSGSLLWGGEAALGGAGAGLLQPVRELQNAVERCGWVAMCMSPDDEHIAGAAQLKGGYHHLYHWNRLTGRMERILEGPKEGVCAMAWHPVRNSCLCSVTGSGGVLIWERVYAEQWSAFAPDFKELDENTEFVEQEDQFDWATPGASGNHDRSAAVGQGQAAEVLAGQDITVDVLHVEADYTTVFSSDDEDMLERQLHHLPVEIEADAEEGGKEEAEDADDNAGGGEGAGVGEGGTHAPENEGAVQTNNVNDGLAGGMMATG